MKVAMVHFLITHPRLLPVRLTLLVPELIWPEPNDQLTLGKLSVPGFEWLAARASFERQAKQPFETALAAQFGLDAAPFGALRLLGESAGETTGDAAREGHWLCADPRIGPLFEEMHADLFSADYWRGLQTRIKHGHVEDVYAYRRKQRFCIRFAA